MRRNIALSLFMTLLLSVILTPLTGEQVYAADNAKQIINAIGIMETDKGSNDNGTKIVTRARFAQMLINASSLKDSVSGNCNVSLFSDVKKTYWAAGYIQTAVTQGWMSGYLNGTFKPTRGISLQEAVYGVLQLLGYTSSDFTTNRASIIMKLYKTKELNTSINKKSTQYLTVNDCYHLFYNALITTNKSGSVYAVSLGYTVDTDGKFDYLSLISDKLKGPIVADENWKLEIPISTAQATFYLDGVKCSIADISSYDVLYYSEGLKSIWVYDNRVTGTVEAISPDYSAPESVTVAGTKYTFYNSDAALKFSSMGEVKEGDIVTLILDKNNAVVDVLSTDEYNTSVTGVVLDTGTHVVKENGVYVKSNYAKIVDASGSEYEENYDQKVIYFSQGDIAKITFSNGNATLSKATLSDTSIINAAFSSDGSTLGSTALASNVKILDVNGDQYIKIYPERLGGVTLYSSYVYYYELNDQGKISQLILDNITGDLDKYGIFTGISISNNKSVYNYLLGSTTGALTTDSLTKYTVDKGPAGFVFTDNTLTKSYSLIEANVTSVGTTYVQGDNMKLPLADTYYCYLLLNGEYVTTTLKNISNLSEYYLTAYYDEAVSAGGRVRVIIAQVK